MEEVMPIKTELQEDEELFTKDEGDEDYTKNGGVSDSQDRAIKFEADSTTSHVYCSNPEEMDSQFKETLTVEQSHVPFQDNNLNYYYDSTEQGNVEENKFSCPYCQYKSTVSDDVRSHILSNHSNDKPYYCTKCSYRCNDSNSLKTHINVKHSLEKPYSCSHCNYRSSQSSNLTRHLRLRHFNINMHPNSMNHKPFLCPYCDHRSTQISNLKSHILFKHSKAKPHACAFCKYRSSQSSNLRRHITLKHSKETLIHKELLLHNANKSNSSSSAGVGAKGEILSDSQANIKPNSISNHQEPEILPSYPQISSSNVDSHFNNLSKDSPQFDPLGSLKQMTNNITSTPSKDTNPCNEVPSGNIASNMNTEEVCTTNKLYQCPYCDYQCIQSVDLKSHIAFIHSNVKPFSCPYCAYWSYLSGNVKRHVRLKHFDIIAFSNVSDSDSSFSNSNSEMESMISTELYYDQNIQTSSSTDNNNYDFSDEIFPLPIVIKSENPEPDSECRGLKNKTISDTLENKPSSSWNRLQTQMNLWQKTLSDSLKQPRNQNLGEKRFQCPYCDHRCTQSSNLKSHIGFKHSKVKPYQCPYCGYGSYFCSNVNRHVRLKHFDIAFLSNNSETESSVSNPTVCMNSQTELVNSSEISDRQNFHAYSPENNFHLSACENSDISSSVIKSENSSMNYGDLNENLKGSPETPKKEAVVDNTFHFTNTAGKVFDSSNKQQKQFQCPYCEHQSTQSGNLKSHIAFKHAKVKPFRCFYCPYGSYLSSNVNRHIKLKHSDATPLSNSNLSIQDHAISQTTDHMSLDSVDTTGSIDTVSNQNDIPPTIYSVNQASSSFNSCSKQHLQNVNAKTENCGIINACFPERPTDFDATKNTTADVSCDSLNVRIPHNFETYPMECPSKTQLQLKNRVDNTLKAYQKTEPELDKSSDLSNTNLDHAVYVRPSGILKVEYPGNYFTDVPLTDKDCLETGEDPVDTKPVDAPVFFEGGIDQSLRPEAQIIIEQNAPVSEAPIGTKNEEVDHMEVELHPNCLPQESSFEHEYSSGQNCEFTEQSSDISTKPYNCPYCEYRTAQSGHLKIHISCRHLKVKPFRCLYCDYCSSQSSNVKRHLKLKHHISDSATLSEAQTPSNYIEVYGNNGFHSDHSTPQLPDHHLNNCSSDSYDNQGIMASPQQIYYLGSREKMYPEPIVLNQTNQFKSEQEICDPVKNENPKNPSDQVSIKQNIPNYHIKTISVPMKTSERHYQCPYCDHKSSQSNNLKTHIACRHSKVKPYGCCYCDYRSSQSSNVRRHIKLRHFIDGFSDKTAHEIPISQKSPLSESRLSKSFIDTSFNTRQSTDEIRTESLSVCFGNALITDENHVFAIKSIASYENRLGNGKKFKCPFCDHCTTQSSNLKTHISFKHSREKSFGCQYCNYRSCQSSNVKRHIQLKHSK